MIQDRPEPEDLQRLLSGVLDGGQESDVGRGRNVVGWGREMDLKTVSGVRGGVGVGTDGGETKSNERQREHDDARSKGRWIEAWCVPTSSISCSLYVLTTRSGCENRDECGTVSLVLSQGF